MAGFRIKAENTTVTRLEQGLGKYQFKGIKAEQSGKLIEKGGVGYSLNIKYSIDGGAFYEQISLDFVRNIEKIIDTYNAIAAFAAILKERKKVLHPQLSPNRSLIRLHLILIRQQLFFVEMEV